MAFSQQKSTEEPFMSTVSLLVKFVKTYFPPNLVDLNILDEQWVNSMMEKIDLNGDGGISIEEFVELNMR